MLHVPVRLRISYVVLFFNLLITNVSFAEKDIGREAIQNKLINYLNQNQENRTNNYIESNIRKLRSFPHLAEAYQLIDNKSISEAKKTFEEYLAIDPLDVKARMAYVMFLYQQKEYSGVIQQCNLAPKQQDALPLMVYRGLANHASASREDALSDLGNIINNTKTQLEEKQFALNMSVFILLEQKFYQKALNLLDKFPKEFQEYDYYMRYAIANEGIDDLNFAQQNYQLALSKARINTESVAAYCALGHIYQKQKLPVKALNAYQSALEINSDDPEIIRSVAHQFNSTNQFKKAIDMINRVLNKRFDVNDQEFLANAQFANKDYLAAAQSYQKILKKQTEDSDNYRVYMLLGYSYNNANQPSKAIEAFQNASKIRDSDPTLHSLASALERKGDINRAVEIYRKLARENPKTETYLKLSNLYLQVGDKSSALKSIDSAFLLGMSVSQEKEAYISQGALFFQDKQYENAKSAFDKALDHDSSDPVIFNWLSKTSVKLGLHQLASTYLKKSLSLDESISGLFRLAEIEKALGNSEQSVNIYRYLAQLRGLDRDQRSKTLENLGMLYLEQGQQQLAIGYLQAAVERGIGRWQLNRNLGIALARYERWNEALEQFALALSKHKSSQNLLNVGRIYKVLNKPDAAAGYYKKALQLAEQNADDNETIQIFDELGYFYAEHKQNDKAHNIWKKSLALQKDPVIEMRVAMLAGLGKDKDVSLRTLENINTRQLTLEQNVERLDYLAQRYAKKRFFSRAIETQKRALGLNETPARHYLLGSYYQSAKQLDYALSHLRVAAVQEPENTTYSQALAKATSPNSNVEQSNESLENLVKKDPENLNIHKDLAYMRLKNSNNDEAEYWFRQAIDIRLAQLGETHQDDIGSDEELSSLRNEVSELTNHFDLTAYYSYRSNDNTKNSAGTPDTLGGILPSQAGVELSYRPPVIGLRNRRKFHLFGRLLWTMKPDSFSIDSDTYQGSFGVRYKPFKSHDFNLSAEKLFQIGKHAQNDWLIRGLYQWSDGYDLRLDRQHWNYTSLFTDLGYFIKSPGAVSFYGEFRQGYSYNLWDLVLTPHAVIDGRIQSHDDNDLSYMAAGVGMSFKYFFNQTRYTMPQSYIELLFQYKAGIVNIDNGVNATGILRF
jgi:tetratricopeptide (TPR) repeat protein